MLSSKTKETALQVLNRTIWTNNKAFKSGASDSPLCFQCEKTETMEHLLYLCPNYSEPLWAEASTTLTTTISHYTQECAAQIDLTPKEIIYNKPHPATLHKIPDKHVWSTVLTFKQETKWDIVFCRMQLKEPRREEVPRIRMQAHLLSVIRKLVSLLEYQEIVQNKLLLTFLLTMQEVLTSNIS
jgi:hypothetical protein